jgi:hypothetical protein
VAIPIPSRPLIRTSGALDSFLARTAAPHLNNEAAPGSSIEVSGWIVDLKCNALAAAWLDIAGIAIPIDLNKSRRDVARIIAASDHDGKKMGFEAVVTVPESVAPGMHDARVIGRSTKGASLYAEFAQRVRIAHPHCEPSPETTPGRPVAFRIRTVDTQAASHTLGRGASTIRQESCLRVSGLVQDARAVQVTATSAIGCKTAWQFACDESGVFDATLWTAELDRGLLTLSFGRIEDDRSVTAVASCEVDIAGPHYLPPLHLTSLLTPPVGEVVHFADAGTRGALSPPRAFTAGRPIGISGWCLDTAAACPPLAVYFEIDGKRPVPLSHHLLDPRPGHDPIALRCGFGGIIDTTRLHPGEHRLRILGAAVSGAGWYVLDNRQFALNDHRASDALSSAAL